MVVIAGLSFATLEIVAGFMPNYLSFALILPLLGLSALTMVTSANAMIQMTSSAQMRGRVSALYLMVFLGGTPFGAPVIGWIGETYGARWTLLVGGACRCWASSGLRLTAGTSKACSARNCGPPPTTCGCRIHVARTLPRPLTEARLIEAPALRRPPTRWHSALADPPLALF